MALSMKYKILLLRAKANPVMMAELNKNVAMASDVELVLIYDRVSKVLKDRKILNE